MSVDESVPQRPVLVAVEDQDSYQAVTWAARAAARAGLGLLVLHVYPSVTSFAGGYGYSLPVPDMQAMQDQITKKANATLEDAVALVRSQYPDLQVTTSLVRGSAPAALVTASHESSMLVVGKRSNRHPLTVGSVSLTVASHAACPVVVVAPEAPRPDGGASGGVVVGVEDSPECDDALAFAFAYASSHGSLLTAVHAWWIDPARLPESMVGHWDRPDETMQRLMDAALVPWRERYPEVRLDTQMIHADPAPALVRVADGAELLVVGSRGRGGFASLLLGSVSRNVLQHATCPVAVVHHNQQA